MERVLLIRLTALGDVVLVEPVVRALRDRFPGVAVDLVTEARHAALAARAMGLDAVVAYDRQGLDAGAAGVDRVVARLPRPGYDLVVDLQGKLRTRALARKVPAVRRLTLQKRSAGRALLALLGHDPPLADRHATAVYLGVLAPLGVSVDPAGVAPRLSRPAARPRPSRPRVGLCPAASQPTKRWPAQRFAELAEALSSHPSGPDLLLVGGPTDRELLAAVRAASASARWLAEDPAEGDVEDLAAALASLDLLVTVDSGPAHLAAAMGVPVVVLFGPTTPVRWGPIGPAHRAVSRALPCMPCSNTGGPRCPRPALAHACLAELGVEPVVEAARAALDAALAREVATAP